MGGIDDLTYSANLTTASGVDQYLAPSGAFRSNVVRELKETLTHDVNDFAYNIYLRQTQAERLRSRENAASIKDFIRIIYQSLRILDPEIQFVPAFPDWVIDTDKSIKVPVATSPRKTITWSLIRREPGTIDAHPFGARKEIKARVREELIAVPDFDKNIDDPNTIFRLYTSRGQWFDNLMQFDIWSKSAWEAEQLVEFFEDFMFDYQGMFLENGINKMYYFSRVRDETILKWRNGLQNRSLIYYIRSERVSIREVFPIKRIDIKAQFRTLLPSEVTGAEKELIRKENEVIQKWVNRVGI